MILKIGSKSNYVYKLVLFFSLTEVDGGGIIMVIVIMVIVIIVFKLVKYKSKKSRVTLPEPACSSHKHAVVAVWKIAIPKNTTPLQVKTLHRQ